MKLTKMTFKPGYFDDANKIELTRTLQESPGMFNEVVVVYFSKWYKPKKKYTFDSKEEAGNFYTKISKIIEGGSTLNDIIKDVK